MSIFILKDFHLTFPIESSFHGEQISEDRNKIQYGTSIQQQHKYCFGPRESVFPFGKDWGWAGLAPGMKQVEVF